MRAGDAPAPVRVASTAFRPAVLGSVAPAWGGVSGLGSHGCRVAFCLPTHRGVQFRCAPLTAGHGCAGSQRTGLVASSSTAFRSTRTLSATGWARCAGRGSGSHCARRLRVATAGRVLPSGPGPGTGVLGNPASIACGFWRTTPGLRAGGLRCIPAATNSGSRCAATVGQAASVGQGSTCYFVHYRPALCLRSGFPMHGNPHLQALPDQNSRHSCPDSPCQVKKQGVNIKLGTGTQTEGPRLKSTSNHS